MYSDIDSNRRKSILLISVFIGILALAGWTYGYIVTDTGPFGLVLALLISLGMTAISWYAGDRIALATAGATELTSKEQFPTLWNVVENLAITAGIPKPRIYIVEDPSPNAFATGRDPEHSSVAVTTGLLTLLDKKELEGVLAHELSHVKNYDSRVMMIALVLVGTLTLMGDMFLRGSIFRRGGRSRERGGDIGAILALLGIAFLILSPLIGQLMKLAISRKREYLADASGALLTRYPEGLASALEKISGSGIPMQHTSAAINHLWISSPTGSKLSNLFSTHPPVQDRINRLRQMISNP